MNPRVRLTAALARATSLAQRNVAQRRRLQQGATAMADHATQFVDAAHASDDQGAGDAITRALRGRHVARQLASD